MAQTMLTISGRVTQDPKIRYGKNSGDPFCIVSVAVNNDRFDRTQEKWVNTDTTFYELVGFGATGRAMLKPPSGAISGKLIQLNSNWAKTTTKMRAAAVNSRMPWNGSLSTRQRVRCLRFLSLRYLQNMLTISWSLKERRSDSQ